MRTLMAAFLRGLCGLLWPGEGMHRAESGPLPAVPAPRPVRRHAEPQHPDPLDGHEVVLVRPYLIAWERELERRLQRERRRAAVLAAVGRDCGAEVSA